MPNLLVRGIPEEIVSALKAQAGRNGRSTEAEVRAVLSAAFSRPRRKGFAEVLASMPNVGQDADFQRDEGSPRPPSDVFG